LVVFASFALGQAPEVRSNYEHLEALDSLTGTWSVDLVEPKQNAASDVGRVVHEWILNKNVHQRHGYVKQNGKEILFDTGLAFWDESTKQIQFVSCGLMGQHSQGVLEGDGNKLTAMGSGANEEGKQTSFIAVFTIVDADTVTWEIHSYVEGQKKEPMVLKLNRVKQG
jgi:hypothetical protein